MMKDRIIDWLSFHESVLTTHKLPFCLWIVGIIFALMAMYSYPYLLFKIYNFELFHQYIFREPIENNLHYLKHGLWGIPLLIMVFFGKFGVDIHLKNIKRIYKYYI